MFCWLLLRWVSAGTSPAPWLPCSVPIRWRPVVSGDPAHQHTGNFLFHLRDETIHPLMWRWREYRRVVLRVFKAGVWLFQGLLKVAVENARVQDKQIQAEKRELKMELYREREMRESLERQLTSELQSRGTTLNPERCFQNDDAERNLLDWNYNRVSSSASIQKRLKKEKKAKRKLQEALEFESKRRERVEDALKHSSSSSPSPEPLHAANNNTKNGTLDGMCVGLFCASSWPSVFHLPAASVCLKSSSSLFLLTCSSLLFSSCLVWLFF